jgi:hypothetical protein
MIKVTEKKVAQELENTVIPNLMLVTPDGDKLGSVQFKDVAGIEDAMKKALEQYQPAVINWKPCSESEILGGRGLSLIAFVNDKKESETLLKNLEDRWIARDHEKLSFFKETFDKDSEVCKKWGVFGAPTLLLVDPTLNDSKGDNAEMVLGRVSGSQPVASLKAFLRSGFAKAEKSEKSK